MKTITLITGGIRSGKSRQAIELAEKRSSVRSFVATAEPFDEEMRSRITRHQAQRAGRFITFEEPLYLDRAIVQASAVSEIVVVDCLTVWLNNLFFYYAGYPQRIRDVVELFLATLRQRLAGIILVTNETGLGIISEDPLARKFADQLGELNQQIAALSDEVIFMVSGIPQYLKGLNLHGKVDATVTRS